MQPANAASLTWKNEDFSKLDKSFYFSKAFNAAERSWYAALYMITLLYFRTYIFFSSVLNCGSSNCFRRLKVFPKGNAEENGNSVSVYLELADGDELPPKKTLWAEYKLLVLDQSLVAFY